MFPFYTQKMFPLNTRIPTAFWCSPGAKIVILARNGLIDFYVDPAG